MAVNNGQNISTDKQDFEEQYAISSSRLLANTMESALIRAL